MKIRKRYVEVVVLFTEDGHLVPQMIFWEDGKKFKIDKVIQVCESASRKAGGQGLRYTCRIKGRDHFLFYEDPAWFVEERVYAMESR